LKSLNTTKYKDQTIQCYRKPAKKPKPCITYQMKNNKDLPEVLIKDFIWEIARN